MLKTNLIAASMFLAAYEILCNSIKDRIKGFYTVGFNVDGLTLDEEYKSTVAVLDKSELRASILWLESNFVIDSGDIARLDEIRKHRNAIAHELPRFVGDAGAEIRAVLIVAMYELLTKIDRWWIRNFEMAIDPGYDNVEVDDSDITSGNMLMLKMIIQIAFGPEPDAYWKSFQSLHAKSRSTRKQSETAQSQ